MAQSKRWSNIDKRFVETDQPYIVSSIINLWEALIVWIKTYHNTGVLYGLKNDGGRSLFLFCLEASIQNAWIEIIPLGVPTQVKISHLEVGSKLSDLPLSEPPSGKNPRPSPISQCVALAQS